MNQVVTIEALERLAEVMPEATSPVAFVRVVCRAIACFGSEVASPVPTAVPSPVAASVAPTPVQPMEAPRAGLDWTEEEEATLHRLVAEGMPMRAIAAQLGRPYEATRKRLDRIARKKTPQAGRDVSAPDGYRRDDWSAVEIEEIKRLRAEGLSFVAIGERMGRTSEAVRKVIRRDLPAAEDRTRIVPPIRPDAWDQQSDDRLLEMFLAAAPMAEIAAALGRSIKACQVRISKLRKMGRFDGPRRSGQPPASESAPAAVAAAALEEKSDAGSTSPVASAPPATPAYDTAPAAVLSSAPIAIKLPCMPAGLTIQQREIWAHLADLGEDDFTPADDLALADGLSVGASVEDLAAELGCSARAAITRFRAMQYPAIQTRRGALTIDGQRDLLAVLRLRAAAALGG